MELPNLRVDKFPLSLLKFQPDSKRRLLLFLPVFQLGTVAWHENYLNTQFARWRSRAIAAAAAVMQLFWGD